jgi:hypothetical protein
MEDELKNQHPQDKVQPLLVFHLLQDMKETGQSVLHLSHSYKATLSIVKK